MTNKEGEYKMGSGNYNVNGTSVFTIRIEHNRSTIKIRKEDNQSKGKGYKADRCLCCCKEIVEGEVAIIVCNNFELFPNAPVHETCFNNLGVDKVCTHLTELYVGLKDFKEKYSSWL